MHGYEVVIRLIKKELPKQIDDPAGFRERRQYTQYLSRDGFVLEEHLATKEEKDFFNRVKTANDTREY